VTEPGRRLIILRHGRTGYNASGRFQGQLDEPLDDVGCEQARAVAPVIAAMHPTALVSSDLRRAADTARCIADLTGLPLPLHAGLREIDLGTWSGRTGREAAELYPDEFAAWLRGEDVRRGDGETYAEVADRALAVLEPLVASQEPGGLVVAVTHGGTSRSITGGWLGWAPESWHSLGAVGNCEWGELREGRGGWRLQRWGMSA